MKIETLTKLEAVKDSIYDVYEPHIKLKGYSESEILAFEQVFGQPFPKVYKEWLFLGGVNFFRTVILLSPVEGGFFDPRLELYQDYLQDLLKYSVPLDGNELFICIDYEMLYYWIRTDEGDDPKVNYYFVDGRFYPEPFEIRSNRLSDFVERTLDSHLVRQSKHLKK